MTQPPPPNPPPSARTSLHHKENKNYIYLPVLMDRLELREL